ncbi:MAG TPA: oxygen-independent coproporphyrinogen III oxidase [Bacteroidia bacterium]|jgi:oxygen-independent coproporphyrinogen-3 oxidase|nr:oxygen-independent coproporphyrinogen III oxidase [Bacteroidia bacterium]
MQENLIKKYNIQAPRYTSYPTVPYWENNLTVDQWKLEVKKSFDKTNATEGISLYLHLPFCQSLCTYCGCTTRITTNHAVEQPYLKAVQKEWEMYVALFKGMPRIKEIHLGGGTPTFFSPANLKELLEGILSKAEICENYEFSFEAHPNNTTYEHLKTLRELGFTRLSLGIQDFDPKVQAIVNRIQTFVNVERVTSQARELGYTSINFDLIYGLPLQQKSSVINTITKVKALKPDRIALYSYAHVPWIKPGQRKFTEMDLPKDEEKRELYETGRAMLEEAGYIEIGMDHFALKTDSLYKAAQQKKLHRNFMGYTHNYTEFMLGLGVSSISDTWYAFAQNVKTVEEYYDLINKGELPVFRGHLLNDDDLVIRRHILNIMCKFETFWLDKEDQTPSLYNALSRLKEMELDGLIYRLPYKLSVTEEGRKFIRNICMAFDARLWKNTPQKEIFSKVI